MRKAFRFVKSSTTSTKIVLLLKQATEKTDTKFDYIITKHSIMPRGVKNRTQEEIMEEQYEEFFKCMKPFMGYWYSLNRVINKWNTQCENKKKPEWCYKATTVYKWFEKNPSLAMRFEVDNSEKLDDLDMDHHRFASDQLKTLNGSPQAAQWILSRKHPDYKENTQWIRISIMPDEKTLDYAKEMISKLL